MFNCNFKELLKGLISYLPGSSRILNKGTGGTNSASYCYLVWFKHLKLAFKNGMLSFPKVIAEIGPGDSLGCGLAGLIAGAQKYYALEIFNYTSKEKNLKIFEKLIELFNLREKIYDQDSQLYLEPYQSILPKKYWKINLDKQRLNSIKQSLCNIDNKSNSLIYYFAPWNDATVIKEKTVNFLFSHAALEHIDNLEDAFAAMQRWLKPGGIMSHQIDFSSHGLSKLWNGHWFFSKSFWKLIKGKRIFLINRQPYSTYLKLLEKYNFKIMHISKTEEPLEIDRKKLAKEFYSLNDEDLEISGALIQAVKL